MSTVSALQLIRASDVNDLQLVTGTYSPAISAAGGTPDVGAGYLTGAYWRIASEINYEIDLFITGGTIAGTSWRITLPFLANLAVHTASTLGNPSSAIGTYQTLSSTAAQAVTGTALLSGPSGSDTAGTALIFYFAGSVTSLGSANFTTTARIKCWGRYLADPDVI